MTDDKKLENPWAFPGRVRTEAGDGYDDLNPGMRLRDWFAGQALAALISKIPLHDEQGEIGRPSSDEMNRKIRADVAESAYGYAHYMLAERERRIP